MKTKRKLLSSVIAIALAVIVGVGMITPATASAASSSNKPAQVSLTSVARYDYNAIKIKWKKASKADYYQVYRATSKSGTYKRVVSTESTSYVNKSLTTGKTYYYKVRAVNKVGSKKYVGKFSSIKSTKPYLSKGKITKTNLDETKDNLITLTYNKVNGATGYQIYRATGKTTRSSSPNTSYKKVATTSKTTVSLRGHKADTSYFYKVRAYKKVGSKYVYGSFSSVKRLETMSHTHWYQAYYKNGKVAGYKCSCGSTKSVSHTHSWVGVKGNIPSGVAEVKVRTVTKSYCQNCNKIIAETPENHIATVHKDENPDYVVCGRYTVRTNITEYVTKTLETTVYKECRICHTKSHKHDWQPVYDNGYYETYFFPSYSFYCSVCDGYVENAIFDCKNHEIADGVTPSYTKREDENKTLLKVWVEKKVQSGYKCSTCGDYKGLHMND